MILASLWSMWSSSQVSCDCCFGFSCKFARHFGRFYGTKPPFSGHLIRKMESGVHIKAEPTDSDEPQSDWFIESEDISASSCSAAENTKLGVQTSDVSPKSNEMCSVVMNTEYYGCLDQGTLSYDDNQREMENTESESNKIKEEVNDDVTIDSNEQNKFIGTDVGKNVNEDSVDFEVDESLSIIVTEIRRKMHHIKCSKHELHLHDVKTHTGERSYECPHCDKAFATKYSLKVHLRVHTGERPFKCSHCNKAFGHKATLVFHERGHTNDKRFKCPYCDKTFITKIQCNDHVRMHTGEKPFQCSHCFKAFSRKNSLVTHFRRHTGEKPYKCSNCDKAFTTFAAYNFHLGTHDGKKLKCSHCSKEFILKSDLKVHLRTHTGEKPYECLYCDKAFATTSSYHVHVRRHTGEKPFECSYCKKKFADNSNFQSHLRTHTGEKPHKCSYCNKAFAQKSTLNVHLQKHL